MVSLIDLDLPLIAAPMAGGSTTLDLVAAAEDAGGFGFLAAGYRTATHLSEQLAQMRARSIEAGVNLFVPDASKPDPVKVRRYAERLRGEAEAVGAKLPEPCDADDDDWHAKLEVLLAHPVPHVSVTFGLPAAYEIRALRRAGSRVWASVTTPAEAAASEDLGVDGVIVQGPRAGGHSATHDPSRTIIDGSTTDAVAAVRSVTRLPLIAGGGIDGPGAVGDVLRCGASAAVVGTMLLRSDESGAAPAYQEALVDDRFSRTTVTRAFTGRPARALTNGFVERHDAAAPVGYPTVHHLTQPMRRAAAAQHDTDRMHLWAGTGHRSAPSGSAKAILHALAP